MIFIGIFIVFLIILSVVGINLLITPSMSPNLFLFILGATIIYTITTGRNLIAFIKDLRELSGGRYRDKQFTAYSEISANLLSINIIGEKLWGKVTSKDLHEFRHLLNETSRLIFRNELFVEDKHWKELVDILREYEEYWLGKRTLWDQYEKISRGQLLNKKDLTLIEAGIAQNGNVKNRYENILAIIREQHKSKLKGL